MLLERRDFFTKRICQQIGNYMRTIDIVMCVVLTPLRHLSILSWTEPHVELSTTLSTQASFQVMGYLRSVDESHIHFLRYFLWHDDILAMGIYQRITVDFLLPIVVGTTEFLIIIIGVFLHIPTAANHGIHDHRNTSLGTSLIYISAEIVGKGSLCISMTLWVWLLIIMSELNDNIIARLDFVKHLLPSALIDKTLRTSAIHSMVIYENLVIETTLEYHTPTSLRTALES